MNVLIVDDQRVMREISKSIAEELGHKTFLAENGEQAIQLVTSNKVDLILLDVEMPGLNGFQTAQTIRKKVTVWFPIIFLSARTEPDFFVEGIRSGGDAYLYKPIVPEVLAAMIRAMERITLTQEELHQAKIKMETLAHRDALTNVVNRRGFDNAIQLEFEKAQSDNTPLTLLMMDVDHFKAYNDNYGHQTGDECLRKLSSIVTDALCRDHDLLARYGGEEFAILLPNTNLADAQIVATRILQKIADAAIPHEFSSCSNQVTISAGMAELKEQKTVSELIESADQNLYLAKTQGRNQIYYSTGDV